MARSQYSIGNAQSALGRRTAACEAWREAFSIYSGLDRDGKLRNEERYDLERLRPRLSSCPGQRTVLDDADGRRESTKTWFDKLTTGACPELVEG